MFTSCTACLYCGGPDILLLGRLSDVDCHRQIWSVADTSVLARQHYLMKVADPMQS